MNTVSPIILLISSLMLLIGSISSVMTMYPKSNQQNKMAEPVNASLTSSPSASVSLPPSITPSISSISINPSITPTPTRKIIRIHETEDD